MNPCWFTMIHWLIIHHLSEVIKWKISCHSTAKKTCVAFPTMPPPCKGSCIYFSVMPLLRPFCLPIDRYHIFRHLNNVKIIFKSWQYKVRRILWKPNAGHKKYQPGSILWNYTKLMFDLVLSNHTTGSDISENPVVDFISIYSWKWTNTGHLGFFLPAIQCPK